MEDKHSKNGWTRLGSIRSQTNPAKEPYVIAIRTGGALGCGCPSMIYRKGTKPFEEFAATCKHIRSFLDGSVALKDLDLTPFGMNWLNLRIAAKAKKSA